jgi:phospholipid/cholesterol/gamma-HCH transport system permease protein
MPDAVPPARADARVADGVLEIAVGGHWRLTQPHPDWHDVAAAALHAQPAGFRPVAVRVVAAPDLGEWDSALPLLLRAARRGAEAAGARFETAGLPAAAVELERLLAGGTPPGEAEPAPATDLFTVVGNLTHGLAAEARGFTHLVGECSYSAGRFLRGQAQFRWRDCLLEMQLCGGQALPIVGVIAVLTGVILAYQAAAQLRQFGADIFVADMVGIAMVREMGPLMTAIVLAGRTGAAFAATLGSMKANEEVDALQTLGVSPVDFLVMPRLLALFAMLPLLVLFANALGILGGLLIALTTLDIPANLYWTETKSFVDLSDLFTGLVKAATYGALIGLAGCQRGLEAERSAGGVGAAATRAVVTSIFLIIVANAVFAVVFNLLGW